MAAAELAGLDVKVILANGTPAALAARHATKSIPIVGASMADPVADPDVLANVVMASAFPKIFGILVVTVQRQVGDFFELLRIELLSVVGAAC
jgi:hypothetical protein